MTQPPKRRSTALLWVLVAALALLLWLSMLFNVGLAVMALGRSAQASGDDGGVDEYPQLNEVWSYGEGEVKAVRIPVYGVIAREVEDGFLASPYDMVEDVLRQIRAARNDDSARAIILEIDSPGGTLTPTDEIYRELHDFKESADDRRVVVFLRDLAASGGYYVAMAGDWIIAEPTAVVGSIGVIMQTLNLKGLGEKIGVRDTTIKSGAYKDLLNPFRDELPEEMTMLQEVVDSLHVHFLGVVARSRQMDMEKLRPLADGRIMTAQGALEQGLIDQIGYWDDVMDYTATLLDEESIKVVRYEIPAGIWAWLSRVRSPIRLSSWMAAGVPRFMYLWRP